MVQNGSANLNIRFVLERDLEDAANAVREKVSGAMRNVPPQVLPPIIQKADPDASPVMSIVLSSDAMSLRTLTEIADKQIKRSLESVDGVGEVSMGGDLPREIHIVVDIEKLNAHGVSIDQVRDAIQSENVEIPGGTLEQGPWEVGLRTLGRIDAADQFKNIIVKTVNGDADSPVGSSATSRTRRERQVSAQFIGDGQPAIQLDIRRASGENTIKVTDAVKRSLTDIQRGAAERRLRWPSSTTTRGSSTRRSTSLEEHLLWGSLLASLVVVFFIRNIRAVLISALAIPASIVATFTLMRVMDFTLNNMTLLGADARRRHRHRRRDRGAREHLPLHRGEELYAVRRGDSGHARSGAAGHGDDAVAGRDLPAGGVHDRLRGALHLSVRLDDGVRDRRVDARELHADADAQLALPARLADAAGDSKTKESRFFRAIDRWYARSLDLVAGASAA